MVDSGRPSCETRDWDDDGDPGSERLDKDGNDLLNDKFIIAVSGVLEDLGIIMVDASVELHIYL